MSKRSEARKERAVQRKKQKIRDRAIVVGMVAVLAVIVGAVIVLRTGEAAPAVAQERLDLDPVLGNPNAPVTIIEYGSYGCAACQSWHQAGIIQQILAAYPDQVNFIFRDYPVIHPSYDTMAAEVAQCALDQGQDQFWAFHDVLYTQGNVGMSQDDVIHLGVQAGLDVDALRTCAKANTHRATVQYDENRGRKLALPGTPAFLVNGTRLFNATPDVLRQTIDRALGS